MGTNYYRCNTCYNDNIPKDEPINKYVHIGKMSFGWSFLFNHNNEQYYSKTQKSIDDFIRSGTLVDEYGTVIDPDEFWKMVILAENGLNNKEYYTAHPEEYEVWMGDPDNIYSDDEWHLRFSTSTEFC